MASNNLYTEDGSALIESSFILLYLVSFFSGLLILSYYAISVFWLRYQTQELLFCNRVLPPQHCLQVFKEQVASMLPIGELRQVSITQKEKSYYGNVLFEINSSISITEQQKLKTEGI